MNRDEGKENQVPHEAGRPCPRNRAKLRPYYSIRCYTSAGKLQVNIGRPIARSDVFISTTNSRKFNDFVTPRTASSVRADFNFMKTYHQLWWIPKDNLYPSRRGRIFFNLSIIFLFSFLFLYFLCFFQKVRQIKMKRVIGFALFSRKIFDELWYKKKK